MSKLKETERAIPPYRIFAQNFSSHELSVTVHAVLSVAFKYYLNIGSFRAAYKENAKKVKKSCFSGDRFWLFFALYMEGYNLPL